MKLRKIIGLLAIPAMTLLACGHAQAFTSIPPAANEGVLDAIVKAQGRNGVTFFCEKIVSIEKSKSNDSKFPAWLYTCQGEALKTYKDPATGVTHNAGEKGNFQFKTVAMNIKGMVKPSKDFSGIVAFQGMHNATGLTSVTLGRLGMLPTVTVDGKSYAVPAKTKLLSDPEGLAKAMSTSPNLKALGSANDFNAAIAKISGPLQKLNVPTKAMQRIDAAMEGESELQQGSTDEPAVYENFDTQTVSLVIKALGEKYYGVEK